MPFESCFFRGKIALICLDCGDGVCAENLGQHGKEGLGSANVFYMELLVLFSIIIFYTNRISILQQNRALVS